MELYKGKYFEVVFCEWCQDFPGYCIISGHEESLGDLSLEAWQELGILEKELERVIKKIFNATMFNFSCLMNDAYKDNITPHVHFHFIPRYKEKLKIFNKTYVDKHFGYNFWKWKLDKEEKQQDIFTEEEKLEIYEMIKKEWNL